MKRKPKFEVGQKVLINYAHSRNFFIEEWYSGIIQEIRPGFWKVKYAVSNGMNNQIWHIIDERYIRNK